MSKASRRDGRKFQEDVAAILSKSARDDGAFALLSPTVAEWIDRPAIGDVLLPGASIGELEQLGARLRLCLPAGVYGRVIAIGSQSEGAGRKVALGYGDELLLVDPSAAGETIGAAAQVAGVGNEADGLVFRSPSAGRFYRRANPESDPFVQEGDELQEGQTVALLEVMKTFTRVQFGGDGMPKRAKILQVLPEDQADVDEGEALFRLEKLD